MDESHLSRGQPVSLSDPLFGMDLTLCGLEGSGSYCENQQAKKDGNVKKEGGSVSIILTY